MQPHPCDRVGYKCHHVANVTLEGGGASLANLIRVMKAAYHVGTWDANRTFAETPEFPIYKRRR